MEYLYKIIIFLKKPIFIVTFNLAFPLEGLDTTFSGEVPFAFAFNPSR